MSVIEKEEFEDDPGDFDGIRASGNMYVQKLKGWSFKEDVGVHGLTLPGLVFQGRKSCGSGYTLNGCDRDGHLVIRRCLLHCDERGCNASFDHWAVKRANRATRRMLASIGDLTVDPVSGRVKNRFLSMMVSVPKERLYLAATKEGRRQLEAEALAILKLSLRRFGSGMVVHHAYRFKRKLAGAKFAYHFHFIVTGWFVMKRNLEIWYEQTGKKKEGFMGERNYLDDVKWLKKKTGMSDVSWMKNTGGYLVKLLSTSKTQKDLWNNIHYLLTHASYVPRAVGERNGEHVIKYFGRASYNKIRTPKPLLVHDAAVLDNLPGMLSSMIPEGRNILKSRVDEIEVEHEYSKSKVVSTQVTDPAGVIKFFSDTIEKKRTELEDHPAKPKSKCETCGVVWEGLDSIPCENAGHDVGEPDFSRPTKMIRLEQQTGRKVGIKKRQWVDIKNGKFRKEKKGEWGHVDNRELRFGEDIRAVDPMGFVPGGGLGRVIDEVEWDGEKRSVCLQKYIEKTTVIIFLLSDDTTPLCPVCRRFIGPMHYVGPPDPEFFSKMGDEPVYVPTDRFRDFESQRKRQERESENEEGGVKEREGVPYFTSDGVWKIEWGHRDFPPTGFRESLRQKMGDHALRYQIKAYRLERGETFHESELEVVKEYCKMSVLDGDMIENVDSRTNLPIGMLKGYQDYMVPK